jgi:methyl-accepting chemotaxis protein
MKLSALKGKLPRISMRLAHRMLLLTLLGGFGIAILLWGAFKVIERVKLGGPDYTQVVMAKDLIADVLPPPELIVEAHLTAWELANTVKPARYAALTKKLKELENDFELRHDFWAQALPEGEMKQALIEEAGAPARKYFELVNKKLLPLAKAHNTAGAEALLDGELERLYAEHRAAIDKVVT